MTKTLFNNLTKMHDNTIQAIKEKLNEKPFGLSPVVYERRMKLENGEEVTKQFRLERIKPMFSSLQAARYGYQYFRFPYWLADEPHIYMEPAITIRETIKEEPMPSKYKTFIDIALIDIPNVMLKPIPLMYTILYRNSRMKILLTYGIGTAMVDPYLYDIYKGNVTRDNPYEDLRHKRTYNHMTGSVCLTHLPEPKVLAKSESEILSRGLLKSEIIYEGKPMTFKQLHEAVDKLATFSYWGSYRWQRHMLSWGWY